QPSQTRNCVEYLGYSNGKGDRPTGSASEIFLTSFLSQLLQLLLVQIESFSAVHFYKLDVIGPRAIDVDREIVAGHQGCRSYKRNHANKPFQQHASVADHS